jgi:hypothetical protein
MCKPQRKLEHQALQGWSCTYGDGTWMEVKMVMETCNRPGHCGKEVIQITLDLFDGQPDKEKIIIGFTADNRKGRNCLPSDSIIETRSSSRSHLALVLYFFFFRRAFHSPRFWQCIDHWLERWARASSSLRSFITSYIIERHDPLFLAARAPCSLIEFPIPAHLPMGMIWHLGPRSSLKQHWFDPGPGWHTVLWPQQP